MNTLKRELTALQRATDAAGQELLALLRHDPELRRRLQALDPLEVLARSPELQQGLLHNLTKVLGGADAKPNAQQLAEARTQLPELAFLPDAHLHELVSIYSSVHLQMSWDTPCRPDTHLGYYILGFAVDDHGPVVTVVARGRRAVADQLLRLARQELAQAARTLEASASLYTSTRSHNHNRYLTRTCAGGRPGTQ